MEEGHNSIRRGLESENMWRISREQEVLRAGAGRSSLTWEQALRVLDKRKKTLLVVVGGLTLAIAAIAFLIRDVYQPTARLEIDPLGGGIRTLHEIEGASAEGDQDYLDTQIQILQSDGLAMRVIRSLRLNKNAEMAGDKDSGAQSDRKVPLELSISPEHREGGFFQEQLNLAEPTPLEASALRAFHSRLSVNPIRGSRLVELSFSSHDPRTAQMVTNTLVTQFIDQNYKNRYATTMEASEWLSAQLNDLRQEVSESNERVAAYQKKYGLVDSEDHDLPQGQLMADVSRQLSDAQADRIQAEAYVRMIDAGQSDSIPALRDDPVYQSLLTHNADVRTQLAQAQTIYGEENANVKKLQNEANEIAAQLDAQRARIINRLRTSFAAAGSREQMMLDASDKLRTDLGNTSSHLVEYRTLKNEAAASANLYNTLQARLREAGIYAGLRTGNIRVVDMAPRLYKPTSPHRGWIIATGLFFSSFLGLALVFVRESFENTVRIPDDIQEWFRLPSLAILPKIKESQLEREKLLPEGLGQTAGSIRQSPKVFWFRTQTAEGEAIRCLRTALEGFPNEKGPQVILISSATGGEGKTTVALNLASVLAQQGRTCLMEGDLRRPAMEGALNLSAHSGLGEVLEGKVTLNEGFCSLKDIPGLTVLPMKSLPENPSDLLSSERMKTVVRSLRESFDFVVIDSPPLIPFSDAQSLARLSDAVILVIRYGQTTRRAITRGVDLIKGSGAPLAGVVLNDMDLTSPDYRYFSYGYSWKGGDRRYPYTDSETPRPWKPDDPGAGPEKSRGAHA